MKKNIIAVAIMVAVSSNVYADNVKPYTVTVDGKTYQSNVVSLTDKGGVNGIDGKDGRDGVANVDDVTGTVTDHAGNEYDLTSQSELNKESADRKDADKAINDRVTAVQKTLYEEGLLRAESNRIVAANAQKKLDKETAAREAGDRELDKRIAEKAAQQSKTNNYFDTKLNNHESRIGNIEQQVNTLKQDVDSIKGGVAQAMAASALVQPRDAGDNVLSAGIGGYDNKQAVAIGYTRNFNDNVAGKVVITTDTESVSYGASVGFSW